MITDMRDKDLERRLGEAADKYTRTSEAKEAAAQELAALMREAYAAKEKQSEIQKATRHVWSVTYLRTVLGLTKAAKRGGPSDD